MPWPTQRQNALDSLCHGRQSGPGQGEIIIMATIAPEATDRTVSIGRVFSRGFGTIASNPLATLGIAFLFSALPSLLFAYAAQFLRVESFSILGTLGVVVVGIFSAIVAITLAMVTQGALVRATVAFSEGRKASLGESASAGLRVALPLFLLGLGSALGMAVGFLLLIVPGIILYVMWSVAAPALVEEDLGPTEAFGRSNYLTDGARWKIFALTLIALVLYWMVSGLVAMLGMAWYGGVAGLAESADAGMPIGYLAVNAIGGTVTSAVWGVIQTSLYVELRDWKDGPQTDSLADIFA
ncbi:MAG: hypothetical protein QOJ91_2841 [Sphingomonadales bacterium]|jgi:uncharacterized membrane protein|nr:hypothetical protein [Sphingomonadales bacterium]